MESSILSEVDDTSILRTGLPTSLCLSSQLATGLSPRAPRSGLERSDFVHWHSPAVPAYSKYFRCWRLTGSVAAVPVFLSLTHQRHSEECKDAVPSEAGRLRRDGLAKHLYLLSARLAPQRAGRTGEITSPRGTFLGARPTMATALYHRFLERIVVRLLLTKLLQIGYTVNEIVLLGADEA